MPIERRRKTDERVKPFSDESFRGPSLDAGNLLERHRFEQNLIRFGLLGRVETIATDVARQAAVTIIQQTTPSPTMNCYWDKIANDLYYGSGNINLTYNMNLSGQIVSSLATGTAPLAVSSATVNANLNADMIDGHHDSYFQVAGDAIKSNPQTGEYRIKSLRLDADMNMVVVYEDVPVGAPTVYDTIVSNPGSGEYRIIAFRLDSSMNIVYVYNDVAEA